MDRLSLEAEDKVVRLVLEDGLCTWEGHQRVSLLCISTVFDVKF